MQEKVLWLWTITVQILCQFTVKAFNNDTSLNLRRQEGGDGGNKALNSFLDYLLPEEGWQCVKGPKWSFFCNECVCLGGQLYICTWRNCGSQTLKSRRQNKNRNNKKVAKNNRQDTKLSLSTFGMDTNCVEGEDIQSFDKCNKCYCGAGKILCTNQKCSDATPPRCTPGSVLPSPDNCNSCSCNTHGKYICTTDSCGPPLGKDVKRSCKPGIWYSTRGDPNCKECFCLNGIMVLCYISMCDAGIHKKVQAVYLESADDLPESCQVDDFLHDKCTKCRCNESKLWSCKTTCDLTLSSKKSRGTLNGLVKGRKKVDSGAQKLSGGGGGNQNRGGGYQNRGGGYSNAGGGGKSNQNGGGYPSGSGGRYQNGGGGNQNNNGNKGKSYGQYVEGTDYDHHGGPQSNNQQYKSALVGDFEPNHNGNGGYSNDGHMPNNNDPNGPVVVVVDFGTNHNDYGGFSNDGQMPNNNHPNGGDFGQNHNDYGGFPNDGHMPNNNHPNGGDFGQNQNDYGGFPNDGHMPNNNHPNGGDFGQNQNDYGGFPNDGHMPNNNHPNGGDFGQNHNDYGGFPNDGHNQNNNHPNGGDFGPNHNDYGGFPNDGHMPNNNHPNGGDYGPNHNDYGGFPNDGYNNNHPNGGDYNDGGGGFPNDAHQSFDNYPNEDYGFNTNDGGNGFHNGGHGPNNGPVPYNGRGPYCITGQYFTQGNINSCQGCYCGQNQWKCYSIRGPCRGYVHSKKCKHGKMKKSPTRPCSVCYCGTDGSYFCATDEYCAYSIKPTHCEAAACHSFCAESNANMGICHGDNCVCLH